MPVLSCRRFNDSTVQRLDVTISNHQRLCSVDLRLYRRIVEMLLAELKIDQAGLGICFVAAPEMTRLNENFLKHHGPTDVITFDYAESGARPSPAAAGRIAAERRNSRASGSERGGAAARRAALPLHGDIFICVDEAISQARRFRTTRQSELVRYIVHGVLHLCGFDDRHPVARREMKRVEDRLLRQMTRQLAPGK